MLDLGENAPQPLLATEALQRFRDEMIDREKPRQLFSVSRMEGLEELKRDVLLHYKSKKANLKARPRVRFEHEEGARVPFKCHADSSGRDCQFIQTCNFLRR